MQPAGVSGILQRISLILCLLLPPPYPRSSMLYHLVIIGDGSPDDPPDISLLFRLPAAKPRKARAKRGPGGAAVEIQKSSGR